MKSTPGRRFFVPDDFSELTIGKPEKSLLRPHSKSGGRNQKGRRTVRYIGGGHKQRIRKVDFKRDKDDIVAEVKAISYAPCRSAHVALVCYKDGEKRYILAVDGLLVGDKIISSKKKIAYDIGNSMPLCFIPTGSSVHNIESYPGHGAVFSRSAGNYATLQSKEGGYITLKMPSGEVRKVLKDCKATIGKVGRKAHNKLRKGKAGVNRWLGKSPRVRGVAMNPVDHPMGGGEGKSSGGHPRSRNGIYAKGQRTRKKRYSDKLIKKV